MEILGLLDALESLILEGFKVPIINKTMVNEDKLLAIIDKIRLVAESGSGMARKAVGGQSEKEEPKTLFRAEKEEKSTLPAGEDADAKANELMQQAYQISKDVREGADKYADDVLANLEVTAMRVLRSVKAGRDRLTKNKSGDLLADNDQEQEGAIR